MDTPELFGGDSDLSDLEEDPGVDAEMDDVEVDDAADPTIERGEDDDDDEWVEPAKKKRERSDSVEVVPAAKRKRKGRKAKLESFGELPLDLLEDICRHLDLQTLYYLSLVNKHLNTYLTTSKSKSLWNAGRETSGLPELQAKDFNDLQYSQLMFGLGCSFCGAAKERTHKVTYALRTRFCPGCADTNLVTFAALWNVASLAGIRSSLTAAELKLGGVSQICYARSEVQFWEHAIKEALDEDADLTISWEWANTVRPGYRSARDRDEEAIEKWLSDKSEAAKAAKAELRAHRKKGIEDRLIELGWSPTHFETSAWRSHTVFNSTAEITDRTWNTACTKLEILLEKQKAAIDLQDAEEAREARCNDVESLFAILATDDEAARAAGIFPLPRLDECLELSSVKAIWEPSDALEVTSLPCDAIAAELVVLKDALAAELFPLILATALATVPSTGTHLPPPGDDGTYTPDQKDAVFELVTSVVECKVCPSIGSFPAILSHRCGYGTSRENASFRSGAYNVQKATSPSRESSSRSRRWRKQRRRGRMPTLSGTASRASRVRRRWGLPAGPGGRCCAIFTTSPSTA